MNKADFREALKKELTSRRQKREKKFKSPEQKEQHELAYDFADASIEAMTEQIEEVASELPHAKQYGTTMQMLRQTKRNIMVEEQMQQANSRINEKNQTGASLIVGNALDTFCNWMQDGVDRTHANRVVSNAISNTNK